VDVNPVRTIATRMPRPVTMAGLLVLGVLLAASLAIIVLAPPASPVSGNAGPIAVTVEPTSGLVDGQVVSIHAKATAGDLFEIRTHLCLPGAVVTNTVEFDFDGPNCSPTAVSPNADYETVTTIPAGTGGEGGATFRVGVGSGQAWPDMFGGTHTLACGPGSPPCTLVVQLQVTDNTVFYGVPVCFGADCPAPDAPPPAPVAAPAAGAGGGPPAAPGDAASAGAASGTGGSAGAHSPAADAEAGGSSQQAAAQTDRAPSSDVESIVSTVAGSPVARRAARVFAGGVAGVLGGCLIAWIIVRGRRRMLESRMA
jgi:hypothetical protein